ncbi:hypothetical protein BH18CHL2_BH18CHL2_11860 [soil metagenome]
MEQAQVIAVAFSGSVRAPRLREAVGRAMPPGSRLRGVRPTAVVALVPAPAAELRAWAEDARRRLAEDTGDRRCTAAVSGPADSAAGAHRALLKAEHAVRMAGQLGMLGQTLLFGDLGPYRFVLGQPERDLRQFSARTLGSLADDEELLRTLAVYLRAQGSLNRVASELHLHRNTVRKRMRRITRLTGSRLDSADERLALQLAILGRRALEGLAQPGGTAT